MIAFLCHPYHRGGVTRWMADMAIAYAQHGEEVFFVTVDPVRQFHSSGGKETIISLLESAKGVRIITAKVGWEFEFGTQTYRASVYSKLLAGNVPTGTPVILSDDFAAWEVSEILKNHYKFVGVLHADDKAYYNLAIKYRQSINVFTCVSKKVKKTLLGLGDFKAEQIYVIPCGIELPPLRRTVLEKNPGIQLAYIGRLTEYQKRVSDLVSIAGHLKNENIEFSLNVIGDGNDRQSFEKQVQETGVRENIQLLGWQSKEKIFEILYHTDLVLLTSAFEGMPIAVMEGLSAGCGIISTRVSGVEDYEFNTFAGNCIWLNDIGDIQQAVTNIQKAMLVSEDTRITAAKQLAESEFSIEKCLRRYDDALLKCELPRAEKKYNVNNVYISLLSYPRALMRFMKVKYTYSK